MMSAIEAHLKEWTAKDIRVLSAVRRRVASSTLRRTFHLVTIQEVPDGRPYKLHVRLARWMHRHRDQHRIDAYLSSKAFAVPKFFGVVEHGSQVATLWRYYRGKSHRTFARMKPAHVQGVVESMADISARSEDAAQFANLPREMRWVNPVAEDLAAYLEECGVLSEHEAKLRQLREGEISVVKRAEEQPIWVLTHNDLVARNVVASKKGVVRLVDWDSASIAPAGASLRAFFGREFNISEDVAELYSSAMRRHGINIEASDVLFTLKAQQIFWYLSSGLSRRNLSRVLVGLEEFQTHFPH